MIQSFDADTIHGIVGSKYAVGSCNIPYTCKGCYLTKHRVVIDGNQTDATTVFYTGRFRHTLLAGTEFGRQRTQNFRNTAYFGGATSLPVPFASPALATGVAFRQSATDADNHATNHIAATYFQDQVELNRWVQVVAGVRYDHFNIDFFNNRNRETLGRVLRRPRAAIVGSAGRRRAQRRNSS